MISTMLPCKQLLPQDKATSTPFKDSLMLLRLMHQHAELKDPDARRPCQLVPSGQQEARPPVTKDSAAVLPESLKAMS